MNVSTAIEVLQDLMTTQPQVDPEKRREAVVLGILALKRVLVMRTVSARYMSDKLPGETER
jgi:hypothetical protein